MRRRGHFSAEMRGRDRSAAKVRAHGRCAFKVRSKIFGAASLTSDRARISSFSYRLLIHKIPQQQESLKAIHYLCPMWKIRNQATSVHQTAHHLSCT